MQGNFAFVFNSLMEKYDIVFGLATKRATGVDGKQQHLFPCLEHFLHEKWIHQRREKCRAIKVCTKGCIRPSVGKVAKLPSKKRVLLHLWGQHLMDGEGMWCGCNNLFLGKTNYTLYWTFVYFNESKSRKISSTDFFFYILFDLLPRVLAHNSLECLECLRISP